MRTETRTNNSIRNIIFACLLYLTQIILSFVVRRYFIYCFNEEFLGLSSLFSNVISVLSLAELGFGSALIFAMYKPMAEGDEEKTRELLQFYKTSYTVIGLIILGLGLLVLPFIEYFKVKAPNVDVNLYVVYIIYLLTNIVSYFFAYRRSLLYASQRNDIESKVSLGIYLTTTILQLITIFFIQNYYVYISIALVTTFLSNLIIYYVTNRMYPNLVKKPYKKLGKEETQEIKKNVFALIFHKVGSVVVYSTDSIVIFIFLNAATLGKYSNYLLITTGISSLISLFIGAIRGSVGNSIALNSKENNFKLLQKLNYIYFLLISFCSIAIFVLSDPFIDTILSPEGASLTLDKSVILCLSISFYFNSSRYMIGVFKDCVGLFYQDRFKSIIESIINLGVSILLVCLIGLPGVIIGTIISTITTSLWIEPYVLNKHYFKKSTVKYFIKYAYFTFAMFVSGVVTHIICGVIPSGGIGALIVKFLICGIVEVMMLLITMGWLPEFRQCISWGKEILCNLRNKKQDTQTVINIEDVQTEDVVASEKSIDNELEW